MTSLKTSAGIEATWFRRVLGQYPTGVCIVTAIGSDGRAVGMSVGSFTSLSLDPPLVVFMPDKGSSSWPKIRRATSFCVNVLAAGQESLCRQFAAKLPDKFVGVSWHPAGSGAPIIDGVVAWIDCDLERVDDGGDHEIAVGRVRALDVGESALPLLFFRGGYGRFSPHTLAARESDLLSHLGIVDMSRADMEAAANDLDGEVVALGIVDEDAVVLASVAATGPSATGPMLVGQRVPAIPPVGSPIMAWQRPELVDTWLASRRSEDHDEIRGRLRQVRERGYSVVLDGPDLGRLMELFDRRAVPRAHQLDPDQRRMFEQLPVDPLDFGPDDPRQVCWIYAPVFNAEKLACLALGVRLNRSPMDASDLQRQVQRLHRATRAITERTGGQSPVATTAAGAANG
jgi:flavin reductase (DIM6/NTAB) family NADH-FMN oxidoreductase RutF/DNA-binding IclR family transcriptional regulator